jgi:iron complex outermembrane receptor protein
MRSAPSPVRFTHHAVAAAALTMLHLGASAQQPAPAGTLQTITITAERRAENIKDVPNSVSALQGEALDQLNASGQDIRQLAGRVPSLNIESSFGRTFPRFYIRGLGNTDFDVNASQPVSLVFDDVVQENPILKGFPIFDMDQIEVLRGPQGTLFGRNAPAGVVKFDSAKPDLKAFGGYGQLTLGDQAAINVEGVLNAPLSPTSALRVSLQSLNRDAWVKNQNPTGPTAEFGNYNDNAARVQLLLQPNRNYSILGNIHARSFHGSPIVFRGNVIKPGTNDTADGFDADKVSHDGVSGTKIRNVGGSARMRWTLGDVALVSVTGYETIQSESRTDVDGTAGPYAGFPPPPPVPGVSVQFQSETGDNIPDLKQFTQEFRLESLGAGPLKWLAGLYYFDEDLNIEGVSYASTPGNPRNGFITQQQKNKAYAVFGSLNYDISPVFKLRGGLRYTRDEKDFVAQRFESPVFGGPLGPLTANKTASNTSFDLSGTYALNKDANLYARVATGFRAPTIQGRILFADALTSADSETVTSVEAGVKADLFDRRARMSLSAFHYEVKDQQLVAVGGAGNTASLLNAAKSVGQGLELDLQAYATERLLISASASLNQTEIQDPNLRVGVCGSGCTVTDPTVVVSGATLAVIDGNPLPNAPKVILNLNARYSFPLAGGDAYLSTDWTYRSKVNFFLYESVEFTGKALTEGGVRAGYIWGNGKYEAAVFVRNLTNQVQTIGGVDFSNLLGFTNDPRTYGMSLRATF